MTERTTADTVYSCAWVATTVRAGVLRFIGIQTVNLVLGRLAGMIRVRATAETAVGIKMIWDDVFTVFRIIFFEPAKNNMRHSRNCTDNSLSERN